MTIVIERRQHLLPSGSPALESEQQQQQQQQQTRNSSRSSRRAAAAGLWSSEGIGSAKPPLDSSSRAWRVVSAGTTAFPRADTRSKKATREAAKARADLQAQIGLLQKEVEFGQAENA